MLGITFHSPDLISLMIDRERFMVNMVPSSINSEAQENLEKFFAKKSPNGMRKLLLVEGIETLHKLAARFPEIKVRLVIFDVYDKLSSLKAIKIVDAQKDKPTSLISVKPGSLNPALVKLRATALEDYRIDYAAEKIELAKRDGDLVAILEGASEPLQVIAVKYLLGLASFPSVKRTGRQDKPRVLQIQQYVESNIGTCLLYAFMDVSLYGTDSKTAALFSGADLEDLRLAISLVEPDPDLQFGYELPEKLKTARERL